LEANMGFHIARAGVPVFDAFERHIGGPFDLRKVDYSLLMLLQANQALTPKQLVPLLALTPPKVTMVVDRLQGQGWITRQRHPTDGRSQQVVLTEQGQDLVARLLPVAQGMEAEVSSAFSSAEWKTLAALLRRLAKP
jgi:MarR family transcriptional regulator for hemolysin